jgi:hypothetical protein
MLAGKPILRATIAAGQRLRLQRSLTKARRDRAIAALSRAELKRLRNIVFGLSLVLDDTVKAILPERG